MPHKRAKRSIREEERSKIGADQAPSAAKQAISSESIPKSVSRILNAAHVREEFREKKRKYESGEDMGEGKRRKRPRIDGGGDVRGKGQGKDTVQVRKGQQDMKGKGKVLGIQPGESLGHFNRRVEDDMRPLVKSAMQTSSAQSRKVKKSEQEEKAKSKLAKSRKSKTAAEEEPGRSPSPPPTPIQKHAGRPTEFQKSSSSAPRRLNDIAQAPPEFKKLPRGVKEAENIKQKGTMGREGVLSMKQKAMMEEEREKAIARYRALKERRRVEGGDGGERDNREDDDE